MKKIIALACLLFAIHTYGQHFRLSGMIVSSELQENTGGKLYYTFDTARFSPNQFIKYDAGHHYQFSANLADVKKKGRQKLYFTLDPKSNPHASTSCVHTIHIKEILASPLFNQAPAVQLESDLLTDFNCSLTTYYGAELTGDERFVGNYQMKRQDTVYTIKAEDALYRYTAILSKPAAGYFDNEYGTWSFNPGIKTLSFSIWLLMNERFGLMLNRPHTIAFTVTEVNGNFSFTNNQATLEKVKL